MSHRLTSSSKQHWGRSCTFITLSWQLNRPLCVKGNGDKGRGLFTYLCILVLVMTGKKTCKTDKTYVLCFKNLHLNSIWIKGKSYCFVRYLDGWLQYLLAVTLVKPLTIVVHVILSTTLQSSVIWDSWLTKWQYCKNTQNCDINWSTYNTKLCGSGLPPARHECPFRYKISIMNFTVIYLNLHNWRSRRLFL